MSMPTCKKHFFTKSAFIMLPINNSTWINSTKFYVSWFIFSGIETTDIHFNRQSVLCITVCLNTETNRKPMKSSCCYRSGKGTRSLHRKVVDGGPKIRTTTNIRWNSRAVREAFVRNPRKFQFCRLMLWTNLG